MHITTRPGNESDLTWLMRESAHFAQGSEITPSVLHELMTMHFLFIAETDEEDRVGMIAGVLSRHPHNPTCMVLTERYFHVSDHFKNSSASNQLMGCFTSYGEANADFINVPRLKKTKLTSRHRPTMHDLIDSPFADLMEDEDEVLIG